MAYGGFLIGKADPDSVSGSVAHSSSITLTEGQNNLFHEVVRWLTMIIFVNALKHEIWYWILLGCNFNIFSR